MKDINKEPRKNPFTLNRFFGMLKGESEINSKPEVKKENKKNEKKESK